MIVNDPIEAVMRALDSGVRTQSMADLEEAGCKVQTSGSRGAGASHNEQYSRVFGHIRRMEDERPEQAATLYTLCAPEAEESNRWIDLMHARVVELMQQIITNWSNLRQRKTDRIEWLAFAAIIERRADLDDVKPDWGAERIAFYLAEFHGVNIPVNQWKRDWEAYWVAAKSALKEAEYQATDPVYKIIKEENRKNREFFDIAA
ncbi:hypothetical protein C7446_2551 [Kushneria sinocarnis]|uniref:Uncharacterized protein n=1 Tax=Kushneria sinocarnis TaxID=595502 RepID=A0A420WUK9_9GAMM|nr:hypothetical protein [Kushneria sinocarnis]RKQ97131.1 hypothetical protein C7446_2551 [Kushneria sinocarnis]